MCTKFVKKYKSLKKLFLLLLFSLAWNALLAKEAPSNRAQVRVYALEKDWSIYDNQLKEYVPFLPALHAREKQLYLAFEQQKYKGFNLSILGEKEVYLFINNNLCYYFPAQQWLHLNIDSLQKAIKQSPLLITYLSKNNLRQLPTIAVTLQKEEAVIVKENQIVTEKKEIKDATAKIKDKEQKELKNFLMIATLGILAVMAVFSITIRPIFSFSFIFNSIDNFLKGKNQIKRLSTPTFVFFLLYYGLTLAFVVMFLSTYTNKVSYQYFFDEANTLIGRVEVFIFLSLLMTLFLIAKYLIIWILGSLYNDRQLTNLHFQEFMDLSQVFCVIFIITTLLANSVVSSLTPLGFDILIYFFELCFLAQAFLMSYRINNAVSYQKLYLFSYLCASEYLPLFLSAKLLTS